jgi:quercetin dioxygenase-like cupin family protein
MDIWDLTELDIRPHHPVVLHSDEGAARVVAINLPAGEELQEHEVHEHAWLHVHHGAVEIADADEATTQGGAGTLVHWRPQERHTVRAVEDALLLLLLAPWPGPGHPSLRAEGAQAGA